MPLTIAIIGSGPRGLSALENIFQSQANSSIKTSINVLLFEKTEQLGCGFIYRSNQPDSNWLNISERALTLAERPKIQGNALEIEAFPSYHQWTGKTKDDILNNNHEVFPKRSEMGQYLRERYDSIASALKPLGLLTVINSEVHDITSNEEDFTILTNTEEKHSADEVVLTIGHQNTKLSKQLETWANYAENHPGIKLFTNPYPIKPILEVDFKNVSHRVGIRGFGLAMIDLVRAITTASGGVFEITDELTHKMVYKRGRKKLKLIPFSLDGLPMACKPLNAQVDALFTPPEAKLLAFKYDLLRVRDDENYDNGNRFLIEAFATIASHQFLSLKNKAYKHQFSTHELKMIINNYLKDADFSHALMLSKKQAPEKIIQSFIDMATAFKPISLDYCIGQVWRHCEPIIYKMMSHSNLKDDVISEVIKLDERMKRYAFGPPIESLQQLLALTYEGTLDLIFVNNPKITSTTKGWLMEKDTQKACVNVMINSVLDSPQIIKVTSKIVTNLLEDRVIQPIHNQLGVKTQPNGLVISKNSKQTLHLALLGRLAKGSIVGVDAILECFGSRVKDWADGVIERHGNNAK
ncbi:FAD/NAD(P)-binding protein [Lacinutrix neustonica]|uniref:FAD/NAD(P)-binding protein n=1 Tax=Lacinutrix neustonica TaxID=2980107 RepID=A0A9E8MXN7_9FLAO|nr:FAD/NAD(P)-binding protein [Lacinutrix neustonica]WAC02174.1 FAD/NAD(P)-binding protein [Lacinutrix neustonica]